MIRRMFPAYAGMNRFRAAVKGAESHVPRVCGDEPVGLPAQVGAGAMFPAYAGMNRNYGQPAALSWDVPRVCGDEPGLQNRWA